MMALRTRFHERFTRTTVKVMYLRTTRTTTPLVEKLMHTFMDEDPRNSGFVGSMTRTFGRNDNTVGGTCKGANVVSLTTHPISSSRQSFFGKVGGINSNTTRLTNKNMFKDKKDLGIHANSAGSTNNGGD